MLAIIILTISISLLIWGYVPTRHETRVQPIAPSDLQLPTPEAFLPFRQLYSVLTLRRDEFPTENLNAKALSREDLNRFAPLRLRVKGSDMEITPDGHWLHKACLEI
ncbi:MAG: hypothetical protein L0Z71_17990 [Anaerolineae bacterium]|nr:hypothetical protein [Anaerolineae bacterium]